MDIERLHQVAEKLDAAGVEVTALRSLETEVAVIACPPGRLGKLVSKISTILKTQWEHVRGELGETSEALILLAQRTQSKEPLAPEEKDKVRAQLLDFVKAVPAGVFMAANAALPIPGSSMLTPIMLVKMGLMPTRWREAHILETLRKEAARLRSEGHAAEADELDSLRAQVETEADEREAAGHNAGLLTQWDANANGLWDEDEKAAYRKELERVCGLLAEKSARKRWFLRLGPEIWGPLRMSELLDEAGQMDEELLVCYDGKSGWVDLRDLERGESHI